MTAEKRLMPRAPIVLVLVAVLGIGLSLLLAIFADRIIKGAIYLYDGKTMYMNTLP